MLRLIADEAGCRPAAGGCFVSGGSAGNLSSLAVGPGDAKKRLGGEATVGALRVVVGTDAHSSIVEHAAVCWRWMRWWSRHPDHRLTSGSGRARRSTTTGDCQRRGGGGLHVGHDERRDHRRPGRGRRDRAGARLVVPRGRRLRRVGHLRPSIRDRNTTGIEQADSFILDPHKWLFTPFDCCALHLPGTRLARATHTQDASYLDVIHVSEGEWNPTDYAYHLTRRARGTAAVVLAGRLRASTPTARRSRPRCGWPGKPRS